VWESRGGRNQCDAKPHASNRHLISGLGEAPDRLCLANQAGEIDPNSDDVCPWDGLILQGTLDRCQVELRWIFMPAPADSWSCCPRALRVTNTLL
jgi:hypothetical protein